MGREKVSVLQLPGQVQLTELTRLEQGVLWSRLRLLEEIFRDILVEEESSSTETLQSSVSPGEYFTGL